MTPHDAGRLREIVRTARNLPPGVRTQFLAHSCDGDQELLKAVMEELRAYEKLSQFLENGPLSEDHQPAESSIAGFPQTSRFRPLRLLGSGGFGTVFEAIDEKTRARVALKVLNQDSASHLSMFKDEFHALAEIEHHPHIVDIYDAFVDGHQSYFTMELVTGPDLVSFVRETPALLRPAFAQLAEAVCFLHRRNMLHRDIKPLNIRVNGEGIVKLLDFGMLRDVSLGSLQTQTLGGTAAYMAPELWKDGTLRTASDWYSVGVVLYEALTGRLPFQGSFFEVLWQKNAEDAPPPAEVVTGIPADLNGLCMGLLDRDPDTRLSGPAVLERLAADSQPALISARMLPEAPLFIGRETQLASLRAALEAVIAGETVCVHIQGRSGMGKTTLCRHFLAEARQQNAILFTGRCYENESLPFKAVDPIVDALGGYLRKLGEQDAAAFLPREKPLQALSHVFPTLLNVEAIRRSRHSFGDEASRWALRTHAVAGLKEILARIAEKRTCIVHIDDFQWGDIDSVDCLTEILAPPDPPRMLFVFSYRSEDVSAGHVKRFVAQQHDRTLFCGKLQEVPVDRLAPGERRELIRVLLGPRDHDVYDQIDRETEGMPLFIHELALHAGSGSGTGSAVRPGVSLQEMMRRRIEQLPDTARRMMEVVGLAIQPLDLEIAREVARLGDGEPAARNLLLAQRLIRSAASSRGQIEPYHDKVREAVVASITPSAAREYFQSLAIALEGRQAGDPQLVYRYFKEAGDLDKADTWIEIAAKRAEDALAFDLAVNLRKERLKLRAVSPPERSFLLEPLARALALAGRGLEAAQTYQAAAQDAAPDRNLRLIRNAGEQYIRSGHFEEGQALLIALLQLVGFRLPAYRWHAVLMLLARRAALRLRGPLSNTGSYTNATPDEAEKLDICRVASLALALQDPIRSAELQARHLQHSLRLGEPYRIANSLSMEAGYLVARRGAAAYPAAAKLLDQVEELAVRSNHPNGRSLAVSVRSKVAWLAGRWEESALYGEEVNRMATEQFTRVAWEAYPSSIFWMCSLACMGRWREVIQRLPGLQADSKARGDLLEMNSLPVFTFAYIRWLLDDEPERALQELEHAREQLRQPGMIPHRFGICYGLADAALYMRDTGRARRAVEEGWVQLRDAMVLRLQPVRIFMLHLRARVACASAAETKGQTRDRFLSEALADARRIRKERTIWGDGVSHLIDASVAAEKERFVDASKLIQTAELACQKAGMEQFATAARYRQVQLSKGDGRAEADADRWFRAQGVANRERTTQMLCPGSWPVA